MKTVFVILAVFFMVGCSALPSMKYCSQVEYKRDGSKITVKAECSAPIGDSIPGL